MRIVAYDTLPSDLRFHEQWNAVVNTMERPQVFYTFEWAQAVARAYGSLVKPLLLAGYRGEELAGIAALAQGASSRQVSFLAASTADYCEFVSAPADREEFVANVMEEIRRLGIASLSLASIPADSASASVLRSASRNAGYSVFSRPAYFCAQVPLHSEGQRSETRNSMRSKLARMSKASQKFGECLVSHDTCWNEFVNQFTRYATAHVSRFLAEGRLSNLIQQQRRAFLLELGRLLSAQGWLAISTLSLERRTIAWNYGFRFRGSWFYYQPAFDVHMAHLSPGSRLLCEILQGATDDRHTHTVDLGLGDEGYKQTYSKSVCPTLHITVSSKGRKAWEFCRYHTAQLVKRSPPLEREIRRLIAKTRSLSGTGAGRNYANGCAASQASEILFLEYRGPQPQLLANLCLRPLSLRLLAIAAMRYGTDEKTLDYVTRSAARLKNKGANGFAVTTLDDVPVCFCWTSAFEDFSLADSREVLEAPTPASVLLFDSWESPPESGEESDVVSLGTLAMLVLETGKHPWTFSPRSDKERVRALERSGFISRFTLKRQKGLLLQRISSTLVERTDIPMDAHPAA